jgi:hypothetical protein
MDINRRFFLAPPHSASVRFCWIGGAIMVSRFSERDMCDRKLRRDTLTSVCHYWQDEFTRGVCTAAKDLRPSSSVCYKLLFYRPIILVLETSALSGLLIHHGPEDYCIANDAAEMWKGGGLPFAKPPHMHTQAVST